jgi:polyferredoxin
MGIDIRNGLQYQCISCALCVDACNTVMDALHYPRGLINYTSEHAIEKQKTRWFKAKNIGYALALLIAMVTLTISIAGRSPYELHVEQIRQPLYVVHSDGRVQNRYTIKVVNKSTADKTFNLQLWEFAGAELEVRPSTSILVGAGRSVTVQAHVLASNTQKTRQHEFRFQLDEAETHVQLTEISTFFFPE